MVSKHVGVMQQQYEKMNDILDLRENRNSVEFRPKYTQLGQNFFVQKPGKQREAGLKLVKSYDWISIRQHVHGIKSDDYPFYEDYPNCKEVLVLGKANTGKSTLINALNGAYAEQLGGE